MSQDYESYGVQWEQNISRLPKEVIIKMLRNKGLEAANLPEDQNNLRQQINKVLHSYLLVKKFSAEEAIKEITKILTQF